MMEEPEIIRLNIRHYQELLKLDRHTAETRQRLIELLADAQAQLPLAQSRDIAAKCVNFK
jgi:hypothetical protein